MIHYSNMRSCWTAWVLILPSLVSGCMTRETLEKATFKQPLFLHDRIDRVEKAVITPDAKLVVLVEGQRAHSKPGPFTIIANSPDANINGDQSFRNVFRDAIVAGWPSEFLVRTDLLAVA